MLFCSGHILELYSLVYLLRSKGNSREGSDDVSAGPPSKKTKHDDDEEEEEEDLGFLIVKGKDGEKQLFVDLGMAPCGSHTGSSHAVSSLTTFFTIKQPQ